MIDFSAFSDELVKIAKEKDLSTGQKAALVGGSAAAGAAASAGGLRLGEALRHRRQILDASKAGKSSVTLRFLKGKGYIAPAVGGALVAGGGAAGALYLNKKRGKK